MKADNFLLDAFGELGRGQPFGVHILDEGHGDLAVGAGTTRSNVSFLLSQTEIRSMILRPRRYDGSDAVPGGGDTAAPARADGWALAGTSTVVPVSPAVSSANAGRTRGTAKHASTRTEQATPIWPSPFHLRKPIFHTASVTKYLFLSRRMRKRDDPLLHAQPALLDLVEQRLVADVQYLRRLRRFHRVCWRTRSMSSLSAFLWANFATSFSVFFSGMSDSCSVPLPPLFVVTFVAAGGPAFGCLATVVSASDTPPVVRNGACTGRFRASG